MSTEVPNVEWNALVCHPLPDIFPERTLENRSTAGTDIRIQITQGGSLEFADR
jgi:hypothetical protein